VLDVADHPNRLAFFAAFRLRARTELARFGETRRSAFGAKAVAFWTGSHLGVRMARQNLPY